MKTFLVPVWLLIKESSSSREDMHLCLTCLQWFSNTMRQVSGSAVQGLEGAALRPARVPGPRGFNLLNQLILDSRLRQVKGHKDWGRSSSKRVGV